MASCDVNFLGIYSKMLANNDASEAANNDASEAVSVEFSSIKKYYLVALSYTTICCHFPRIFDA
jgi:hypothetical protein